MEVKIVNRLIDSIIKINLLIFFTILLVSCDNSFNLTSPLKYQNSKLDDKCMSNLDCDNNEICSLKEKTDEGNCIKNPCIDTHCYDCRLDKKDIPYCYCSSDNHCNSEKVCNIYENICVNNLCKLNELECKYGECKLYKDRENYLKPYCECDNSRGYYSDNNKTECINPCDSDSCLNGVCIADSYNSYHCECDDNYYLNENNTECINPCDSDSCLNGVCIADNYNSYHCECNNSNGYYMDLNKGSCVNPCLKDDIDCNINELNVGVCIADSYNSYHCDCENIDGIQYYDKVERGKHICTSLCHDSSYNLKCKAPEGALESENGRCNATFTIAYCSCKDNYQDNDNNLSCNYSCSNPNVDLGINPERKSCDDSSGEIVISCKLGYGGEDCSEAYFVTKWKTDNISNENSSATNELIIPTFRMIRYNYDIDCDGDGIFEIIGERGNHKCVYDTPGVYTVVIKGVFPTIYFGNNNSNDKLKILFVEQWGDNNWETLSYSFQGCENLNVIALDTPNLSNVTNIGGMFAGTSFNQDINNWDTSNIEVMDSFFRGTPFNHPLNFWDVSNVTNMNGMFENAINFNQDLSSWDVSNVVLHYDFSKGAQSWSLPKPNFQ